MKIRDLVELRRVRSMNLRLLCGDSTSPTDVADRQEGRKCVRSICGVRGGPAEPPGGGRIRAETDRCVLLDACFEPVTDAVAERADPADTRSPEATAHEEPKSCSPTESQLSPLWRCRASARPPKEKPPTL